MAKGDGRYGKRLLLERLSYESGELDLRSGYDDDDVKAKPPWSSPPSYISFLSAIKYATESAVRMSKQAKFNRIDGSRCAMA